MWTDLCLTVNGETLLLDKSGSMERADRVEIIHQALRVLAAQLQAQDTLSVVVFARTVPDATRAGCSCARSSLVMF